MESPKQVVEIASPAMDASPGVEPLFSSLLYDVSQQVQEGMDDLLKMINEIDVHNAEVVEEVERCKESAVQRRKAIEEETECFQKAAYAVLDVLNIGGGKTNQMVLELDNHQEF
ncbi:hypothetical protein Dimus_010361 [Dionaea muscipula]